MSDNATSRPSTPGLLADALSQVTLLFETEIRLLRSELSQKITQAITSVGVLLVSGVLLLAAFILILQGVVDILVSYGWRPFAANFLVGIIIAIIGGVAIIIEKKGLSASNLAPSRTIHQLGKDAKVIKEQVK